ncbi:MAG: alpha/beta hydrolase [Hydrogenophilales bacterium 28-61-23]|nr:MAG: alpha/beta hydrolase [Hydrogenophilales bacterium 28-61-23]
MSHGHETYQAPFWLPGGNLQTIWGALIRAPKVDYRRERWELPDGDFIDLDWLDGHAEAPLVVLFHGLEGDSRSVYALHLMAAVKQLGWRGVVPHFRGCSGEANRLPRAYFAGDSAEIGQILRRLRHANSHANGHAPIYAAGVSLGGNALLKWLGEQGESALEVVRAAAAISAPLDLPAAGAALDRGFCRVYTARFLKTLKSKTLAKLDRHPGLWERAAIARVHSIKAFDTLVTAPLHGYRDADDYWAQAASKPGLGSIVVPTLLINARNDPFMPGDTLPGPDQVSPWVTLDFPDTGGHVGFVTGPFPGASNWLPKRLLDHFAAPA